MMCRLSCSYMGRATTETMSGAELDERWTFLEMGEDLEKADGGQFEDADGPVDLGRSPLSWKDGRATETGCGPWWKGFEDATADYCDSLLTRAGMPALVRGAALGETFDVEGENAEALAALDRAEWMVEALPGSAPPE